MSLTLQLIKRNSKDLQKVVKDFNGTAIFTFPFIPFAPSTATSPIRLDLYLSEELFALHTFVLVYVSSLQTALNFLKYQNSRQCIQSNCT